MSFKKRILNILFWSVISAAFIGPGTVTTAASSGAEYGTDLLWALLFSTLACLLLQEAAARITIVTGMNLGQSISAYFVDRPSRVAILSFVLGAIFIGNSAYEMGNLLGAVEGIKLLSNVPSYIPVLFIGATAAILLSLPSLRIISTILGMLVVLMGLGFLVTAVMVKPDFSEIVRGTFVPSFPGPRAGVLVLALIGTTIVPYNLFLGSGLSTKSQTLKEMRFGLGLAIILGGIFSMAVLISGSAIAGSFSFEALASVLQERMGTAGKYLLGFGLFAAGFTSTVTAPLAAAITLSGLFGHGQEEKWGNKSWRYRVAWIVVLLTGTVFALLNFKPVPAIIIAQALNGFLLPFVSIFLYVVIQKSIDRETLIYRISNIFMLLVIFISLIIGLNSAVKALAGLIAPGFVNTPASQLIIAALSLLVIIMIIIMTGGRAKRRI
ncbi:MAG: Nramp family divalent metal transporter [Bacteroidales bacterium]|nr:Nramp family divalent metal transporter [Bacteroidales bacterium]